MNINYIFLLTLIMSYMRNVGSPLHAVQIEFLKIRVLKNVLVLQIYIRDDYWVCLKSFKFLNFIFGFSL